MCCYNHKHFLATFLGSFSDLFPNASSEAFPEAFSEIYLRYSGQFPRQFPSHSQKNYDRFTPKLCSRHPPFGVLPGFMQIFQSNISEHRIAKSSKAQTIVYKQSLFQKTGRKRKLLLAKMAILT